MSTSTHVNDNQASTDHDDIFGDLHDLPVSLAARSPLSAARPKWCQEIRQAAGEGLP